MASKKIVKKELPTMDSLSEKFGQPPAHKMMKEDEDLMSWLNNVFELKRKGELYISYRKLSDEVSEYLGVPVSHHVINKEYHEWLLKNRIN